MKASAFAPQPSLRPFLRESLLCFAAFCGLLFVTHSGFDTSEARFHYAIARRVVTEGELSFPDTQSGTYFVAPNGRTYAAHEIGSTLFLIPMAYLNIQVERVIGKRLGKSRLDYLTQFTYSLQSILYAAGTLAVLYFILRRIFAIGPRVALAGVALTLFCTFYWEYSRTLFDGMLCGLLWTLSLAVAFLLRRSRDLRLAPVMFCLLGLAFITRLSMVIPIAATASYFGIAWWPDRRKLVQLFLIGALCLAPFIGWQLYYNHLRTGNPVISPVQMPVYADNNGLDGSLTEGLTGLLFSPGKSIFVYCPLAVLSLFCLRRFWKSHPAEAVYVAVAWIAWLVLHAKLRTWYGAWGWGPRHFVTLVPLMALPFLVHQHDVFRRPLGLFAARAALAWGFVLHLSAIIGNHVARNNFASFQGRINELVWDPWKNQPFDMIGASLRNLQRVAGGTIPFDAVPGQSPSNILASNTVNVWLFAAMNQGVPVLIVGLIAILALSAAAYFIVTILRTPDFPSKSRHPVADTFEGAGDHLA